MGAGRPVLTGPLLGWELMVDAGVWHDMCGEEALLFVLGGYAMRCSESAVMDVARDMYMVFVLGLRSRPALYMYVNTYQWMEVTGVVDTNVYRVRSIEYF